MKNNNHRDSAKKTKSLWFVSWYPSREEAYGGDFIMRHAEATQAFCDVAVIYACPTSRSGKKYEVAINPSSDKNPLEIRVYFSDLPKPLRFLKLLRFAKAHAVGLRQLKELNFGKPDNIHLHAVFPAGLIALCYSFFHRLPLLVSEHWTGYRPDDGSYARSGFLQKMLTQLVYRRAKLAISETDKMTDVMLNLGLGSPKKFRSIPNVVQTELFFLKKKSDSVTIRLLHVSTLGERHKNFGGILNAVAEIAKTRQDFVLTVVGTGDEMEKWKRQVAEKNIQSFVHFLGGLPLEKVAEQMQSADFFVLFSNFEGLPCVLLEAMAAGLPVIATETGGISDWVGEREGILLRIGDDRGLQKAMLKMLDTFSHYDRAYLHQNIKNRCSYERIGEDIFNIYQSLGGG